MRQRQQTRVLNRLSRQRTVWFSKDKEVDHSEEDYPTTALESDKTPKQSKDRVK